MNEIELIKISGYGVPENGNEAYDFLAMNSLGMEMELIQIFGNDLGVEMKMGLRFLVSVDPK